MNLLPRPRVVDVGPQLTAHRVASTRVDASLPAEGYALTIDSDGAAIVAADGAGLFYARATLAQLAHIHDGMLPVGTIRDHPDLPVRGVMIDISRDKVPTMSTLRDLIDRLASWKINHVQLYSEHTFAYRNHLEVHAGASPLTADEIRELDAFCRDRHIELVPNQNCLGHMNRWLLHERYRALAIAPDGFVDPYGLGHEAMTIDPAHPGSLELVRELLGELLPLFSSRRVNIGLDETWELPKERLGEFFAWAATLRALPELDGREVIIWGDMFSGDPALIAQVPAGVTVCEWGYDAEYPFDERTALLAAAGLPFWVAPGTSSWLSIAGRVTNAVEACRNAAAAAITHGGRGYLNTDWGDRGHLQQLPISDPGFAFGAAVSWCLETNADIDLGDALSVHAYDDDTGRYAAALLAIGDAHRAVTPQIPNHSVLAMHLYFPQIRVGRGLSKGLTLGELDTVEGVLRTARADLDASVVRRIDASLLVDEMHWTIDVMELLVADARARIAGDGTLASVPEDRRRELVDRLGPIIEHHRTLWLARNRPGGLGDSAHWLEHLRDAYATGQPDPAWAGWPARFS
ncbi:MAG: glycoside hydrolase, family 20 [Actinomycetia bacterium]|nr:glycoside hydrolase, family 20 [Actinomycetes bacterium]